MSRARWLFGLVLSLCLVEGARAEELAGPDEKLFEREVLGPRLTRQERPFGFVVDPTAASAGVTSLEYRAGFASGLDAERPIPAELATSGGGSHAFTVAYGLTTRIAPYASASLFDEGRKANLLVGAHVLLTPPTAPLRIAVRAAGLREAEGKYGAQLTGISSLDVGPLRLAGNVQAEKVFDPARDKLDVIITAGTSWALGQHVRIGAEYVGQDLEGLWQHDEAEGGARHMVGPDLAIDLDGGRYQLVVAGGFGLSPQTPRALFRLELAASF
jgi:hypothetical protein